MFNEKFSTIPFRHAMVVVGLLIVALIVSHVMFQWLPPLILWTAIIFTSIFAPVLYFLFNRQFQEFKTDDFIFVYLPLLIFCMGIVSGAVDYIFG